MYTFIKLTICFEQRNSFPKWTEWSEDLIHTRTHVHGLFSEKVHQGGWPCSWLYYSFVVNKKIECWWFSCVSCNKYIIFKNIITYLSCLICIIIDVWRKNPPKTWPICDIMTGTIKSVLGHVLHAMLSNKTNLPENNICSALHTILKRYDNCHGFCPTPPRHCRHYHNIAAIRISEKCFTPSRHTFSMYFSADQTPFLPIIVSKCSLIPLQMASPCDAHTFKFRSGDRWTGS